MDENKSLVEVIPECNVNSFGALLFQSTANLKSVNALLDKMQESLMAQFDMADLEGQIDIFKAIISRGKYESQVHSYLLNAMSKDALFAKFFKELFNASSSKKFDQAPLTPELKAIVDMVKGTIRNDIQGS